MATDYNIPPAKPAKVVPAKPKFIPPEQGQWSPDNPWVQRDRNQFSPLTIALLGGGVIALLLYFRKPR